VRINAKFLVLGAGLVLALYVLLGTTASASYDRLRQAMQSAGLTIEAVPDEKQRKMNQVFFTADGGASIFGLLARVVSSTT